VTFDAHPRSSLIVALDFDSLSSAVKFAKQVADLVGMFKICLLYTSDAADDMQCVDLGGRRIIKKK